MAIASEACPPGEAETQHWVVQAQAGDLSAFERLYRRNVNRVHALCRRMCADPVRARDLTQDTFVRAYENLKAFRGDSAFSTWLHRLAVNVALTDRRSEGRRTARVTTTDDLSGFGVPATPVTVGIDLERAIASLPPTLRTAFVLHDVEGYTHEEIAERTGQSPVTVRVQLHRARKSLRERLSR